jgi:hypothetical protein
MVIAGLLSPLDGRSPHNLQIDKIKKRVTDNQVTDIILALDPPWREMQQPFSQRAPERHVCEHIQTCNGNAYGKLPETLLMEAPCKSPTWPSNILISSSASWF